MAMRILEFVSVLFTGIAYLCVYVIILVFEIEKIIEGNLMLIELL